MSKKEKTIIIIDALNQLDIGLKDIGWLPLYGLPENIKLIVSFRDDATGAFDLLQKLNGNPQNIRLGQVRPFENIQDRINLINAFLSGYLKDIDAQLLREIIDLPGAENPLFLKIVLSELRVFGSFTKLAEKINKDFGTSPIEAFDGVLTRLESDPTYSHISPEDATPLLFGLLAHARNGLSEGELATMFLQVLRLEKTEENTSTVLETVHLFLRQVRPFLARRDGRYDFFYESFKMAALKKYNQRNDQEWHQILARYFDELPLWENREELTPIIRKVTELPYHLTMSEMWADLEMTLSDLAFLEAKIKGGLAYDLLRDLDMEGVIHTLPNLSIVRRSLTSIFQGVCERPNHALSMLYNQISWMFSDSMDGVICSSLERARKRLELKPWLRANAPLPGMERVHPHEFKMSPAPVQSLDMAIMRLVTIDFQSEIIIRDILTGEEISKPIWDVSSNIIFVTLSMDGSCGSFITKDRRVFFESTEAPWRARANEPQLVCVHGPEVIGVRDDDSLVAWNPTNGKIQVLLDGLPYPVAVLRRSANGSDVLFVAGYRKQICGVLSKKDSGWSISKLPELPAPIIAGDVDSGSEKIVLTLSNAHVVVFNLKNREIEQIWSYSSFPGGEMRGMVKHISFGVGPSAGTIFIASEMGQVGSWNPSTNSMTSFGSYKTRREGHSLKCFGVWPDSGLPFICTESYAQTLTSEHNPMERDAVTAICFTEPGFIVASRYVTHSICFYTPSDLVSPVHSAYVPWPLFVSPREGTDEIWVGSKRGEISLLTPGQDRVLDDVRQMQSAVIGVFNSSEPGMRWVAEENGDISCSPEAPLNMADSKRLTKVLWCGTGYERRIKVLPASPNGSFWGMKTLEDSTKVFVDRIDAPLTSWGLLEGRGWKDFAVSPDYGSIAIVGHSMVVYSFCLGKWVDTFSRQEPGEKVVFCCEGQWMVTASGRWLQLHRIIQGLPVEAAQDMGGTITCLASNKNCVAVGMQAGSIALFVVESYTKSAN
jgi:hypothetical protein